MGLVSLTAFTCTFFLLTSLGQIHQQQQSQFSSAHDDFAEFDEPDEYDSIASSLRHQSSGGTPNKDEVKSQQQPYTTDDSGVVKERQPVGGDRSSQGKGSTEEDEVEDDGDFVTERKKSSEKEFSSFEETEDDDEVLIEEEDGIGGGVGGGGSRSRGGGVGVDTMMKRGDNLKVIDVPEHLRTKWDGFYLEFLLLIGLISYALNFFYGKQKNQKLASTWLEETRGTLERNFAIVGDNGEKELPVVNSPNYTPNLIKESEHIFCLWCSGRVGCQGLLIDLKFVKRQDIISIMSRMMKPSSDVMEVNVTLDDDFESLIFAFGTKKVLTKNLKELQDLSTFCDSRRSCERFKLASHYCYTSELAETAEFIIDSELQRFLKTYPDLLEYMHISDQYSGKKPDDSQAASTTSNTSSSGGSSSTPAVAPTSVMKVLQARFTMPKYGRTQPEDMKLMVPCLKLVLYYIDKLKKVKLSKDAKAKAEKNRAKMEESISKLLHSQRQESQQLRKEEKIRQEKERLMAETDPDKLRKLEEAQAKRDRKRTQPKMKSMMVRMK